MKGLIQVTTATRAGRRSHALHPSFHVVLLHDRLLWLHIWTAGIETLTQAKHMVLSVCSASVTFLFNFIFYASRQTHKAWRPLQGVGYNVLSRGHCHLLLELKQGDPFDSPYGCRLGYHQSEAWPVEQKALPSQFYVVSVTTGIRTHTLLIKHQSLNPVLLTARPWHACISAMLKKDSFLQKTVLA